MGTRRTPPSSPSQGGNGPSRAVYEITAPNGIWNALANGTYTVSLNATQVADVGGGFATAGSLGTFNFSAPFAYLNGSQLVINSLASNPSISMSFSGSSWFLSNGSSNLQFNPSGFSSVDFVGTSGDDSLTIASALSDPLTFNGGTGNDSLSISAGSMSFNYDLGSLSSALNLTLLKRSFSGHLFL